MRTALAALALTLAAGAAEAGAWPRAEGETFVALSGTVTTGARTLLGAVQDIRNYSSIYAEHGWTPRLTFGLDAGYGNGRDGGVTAGLVFARLPVWEREGGDLWAVELGLGFLAEGDDDTQARVRPGFAWGRGFESRWGGGWLGLEASAELRLPSSDVALKADATAGLKPTENWMLILQLQSGDYPGTDPILRLAPSVVRRLSERTHVQLGGIASLAGDDAYGLKLGLWLTF